MGKKTMDLRDRKDVEMGPLAPDLTDDEEKSEGEKLRRREESWSLTYETPEGRTLQGTVTSRIMTFDERIMTGRLARQLAQGSVEDLDKATRARVMARATLAIQIREAPAWTVKWLSDDELLISLYGACQEHDALFFRGDRNEGEEDQKQPRVHITTPVSATRSHQ